jgi:hypothetical protein
MAIYHITPANSVFNQLLPLPGIDAHAFDSDSAGPDTLIVDPGAFLISVFADGAFLAPTGAWTVNVNGVIASPQTSVGIDLAAGNTAVSTINIGVDGGVQGQAAGIFLGSPAKINNAGTIVASGEAGIEIANSGTNPITNSGNISSTLFTGFGIEATVTSNDTLHNSGTIDGINLSAGNDTVTNSGLIAGFVRLGDGHNHLTSSGDLGSVSAGSGDDTVRNSGELEGVQLGEGDNHLTNSGRISDGNPDLSSYSGGSGADTVTNTGNIEAAVRLGDGDNTLTNSGTITGFFGGVVGGSGNDLLINSGTIGELSNLANVQLGDGNNTLINSGKIFGDVSGGSGADTMTDFAIVDGVMQSGAIRGTISFGGGNDTFTGGANFEMVQDGNGADTYRLGGGNDWYVATGNTGSDGNDLVLGGTGIDVYDAQAANSDCQINLDSFSHGPLAPNTALGADIAGSAKDSIFGFETVFSGSGNDVIYGTAAGNTLFGDDGNDSLFGLSGNDKLDGGDGNDDLFGGAGADELTGGFGADTFHYTALSDSGITAGTRDLIADFNPLQGDKIDLSAIDANTKTPGNDAFTFIGTNVPFTGAAGDLRGFWTGFGQIIEGDVNGDKKPDFSIALNDPTHAITLTSASFVL